MTTQEELITSLPEVFAYDGPVLIDCRVLQQEKVYPNDCSRKGIHEMIGVKPYERIITATVQNRSGVLNRVTGLLQRRQFNIESISVGPTETEGISKMTLVVEVEDEQTLEQVTKQLNKQIDVLKVSDITDKAIVARELALIKVAGSAQLRSEINGIIEPFRAIDY